VPQQAAVALRILAGKGTTWFDGTEDDSEDRVYDFLESLRDERLERDPAFFQSHNMFDGVATPADLAALTTPSGGKDEVPIAEHLLLLFHELFPTNERDGDEVQLTERQFALVTDKVRGLSTKKSEKCSFTFGSGKLTLTWEGADAQPKPKAKAAKRSKPKGGGKPKAKAAVVAANASEERAAQEREKEGAAAAAAAKAKAAAAAPQEVKAVIDALVQATCLEASVCVAAGEEEGAAAAAAAGAATGGAPTNLVTISASGAAKLAALRAAAAKAKAAEAARQTSATRLQAAVRGTIGRRRAARLSEERCQKESEPDWVSGPPLQLNCVPATATDAAALRNSSAMGRRPCPSE